MAKLIPIFAAIFVATAVYGAFEPGPSGSTPPPCQVPNPSFCGGKSDGNFESPFNIHDFVQCSNGRPYCQSCWPHDLEFSEQCNQCLYNKTDACYTTQTWATKPTFNCPDECPSRGPNFKGNIRDPTQPKHYIACWKGVTVGCVNCPHPLEFNETWNACLYEGKYKTQPL
ncbi:uncharacterized protein LOC130613327 [Hydractinia symbiolongicarpus]|uniref:uncharacterized protein LOC130613327 n=1 Tax=Hydractinia symbiolongicarpus TaxID=13093 RepID=UPI00254D7136|nr:uncharacterized protein LOC130613327 [Hydractinia symbiolongicarpus]